MHYDLYYIFLLTLHINIFNQIIIMIKLVILLFIKTLQAIQWKPTLNWLILILIVVCVTNRVTSLNHSYYVLLVAFANVYKENNFQGDVKMLDSENVTTHYVHTIKSVILRGKILNSILWTNALWHNCSNICVSFSIMKSII